MIAGRRSKTPWSQATYAVTITAAVLGHCTSYQLAQQLFLATGILASKGIVRYTEHCTAATRPALLYLIQVQKLPVPGDAACFFFVAVSPNCCLGTARHPTHHEGILYWRRIRPCSGVHRQLPGIPRRGLLSPSCGCPVHTSLFVPRMLGSSNTQRTGEAVRDSGKSVGRGKQGTGGNRNSHVVHGY